MNLAEFEQLGAPAQEATLSEFEQMGAPAEMPPAVAPVGIPEMVTEPTLMEKFTRAGLQVPRLFAQVMGGKEGIKRQAGLTARNVIEGAGGAIEFLGAPLKLGVEAVTGKPVDLGMFADVLELPQPETQEERIISETEKMMAGAGGVTGLSGKAAELIRMGVPQRMLQALASQPGAQAATAGTMGAAGQIAAEEGATPEEQMAISLAAGFAVPGTKSGLLKPKYANRAYIEAHKLGYKVPPALAKPSTAQQLIEGGIAGSAAVRQKAAIYNQGVTNRLIKEDIGYPQEMPLSQEGLETIRAQAGAAYERARKIGTFNADDQYLRTLKNIAKTKSAMAREFPEMVKKDIVDMVGIYNKDKMSADAVIEAVKQLRADANAGFISADPAIKAMAQAKGKIADSLEALMERQAKASAPELVPELRNARRLIAKTYTIGKALKGENIDARILGRELDKGKPLSGLTKKVAKFGRDFKGAAMTDVIQPTNFRVTDLLAGAGVSGLTGQPAYMALIAARPTLRSAILSKPYQSMLAKARPQEMEGIMRMPKEVQAAEMLALLDEIQQSGEMESK